MESTVGVVKINKKCENILDIISQGKEIISLQMNEGKATLIIGNQIIDEFRAEMVDGELIINLDDGASNCEAEKLRANAERAFRKAIEFQPDFVSVHAALARIYRKKYVLSWEKIHDEDGLKLIKFMRDNLDINYLGVSWLDETGIKIIPDKNNFKIIITKENKRPILFELNRDETHATLKIGDWTQIYAVKKENCKLKVFLKDPSQECNEAKWHKQRRKQTDYNRACYEINCGDETKARELLEKAMKENQVSHEWFEDDPDWDLVRCEQWFNELLNQHPKGKPDEGKPDVYNWILRKAIRNKLDNEGGKCSLSYCQYDIVDPKTLAKKILFKSEVTCSLYCKILAPFPIIKLDDQEKNCLESYYNRLNTKALEDSALGHSEPYSIQRSFIEKKVEISVELKEVLCNILNRYVTRTGNDADKIKNMKYLEKVSTELNKIDFLELSEDGREALEGMSFLVRARSHAVSGENEKAFNLLYFALNNNQISEKDLQFEPDFEFIREEPQFKDIMEKLSRQKKTN